MTGVSFKRTDELVRSDFFLGRKPFGLFVEGTSLAVVADWFLDEAYFLANVLEVRAFLSEK